MIKTVLPTATAIIVCAIAFVSNVFMNNQLAKTNLLIADRANEVTQEISAESQVESKYRYIADVMINNIGTNKFDFIIENV